MSVKPDRVIHRPLKGLLMTFFPDCVVKDLSADPKDPQITRNEQTRRLTNEIKAYIRFNELKCDFIVDTYKSLGSSFYKSLNICEINETKINLFIWDINGDHEFIKFMIRIFTKGTAGCLLFIDISNKESILELEKYFS